MIINDIIKAKPLLDTISNNNALPTRIAYKLYILLSELTPSFEFFNERNRELFKKYGVEEGENLVIPKENQELFYEEYNELVCLPCEKEIDKIDISLDVDLGISAVDIFLLKPFINFVE